MLTGVDTHEFTETGTVPVAETCDRYGVAVVAEDSDTVVIATADLLTLFGELQTYNLTALDLESPPQDLPARWCTVWDAPWPVLPRSPESTVFVSSHDDSGVWVEARDVQLSRHLGQRLLAIVAGTQPARRARHDRRGRTATRNRRRGARHRRSLQLRPGRHPTDEHNRRGRHRPPIPQALRDGNWGTSYRGL